MQNHALLEHLEPRTLLAAVHWDGGGGDENWHNPLNWSGDVLPGPGDDVTIDIAGEAITVRFSAGSATVASLFSTERLEMEGGALTVAGEATFSGALIMSGGTVTLGGRWAQSGPMEMSGGIVVGTGHLETTGAARWSGGAIGGTGEWRVLGGDLQIRSNVQLQRRLVNSAQVSFEPAAAVVSSGDIVNRPGGYMTIRGGVSVQMLGATVQNGGFLAFSFSNDIRGTFASWGSVHMLGGVNRFYGWTWWGGTLDAQHNARISLLQPTGMQNYHTFLAGASITIRGTLEVATEWRFAPQPVRLVMNAQNASIAIFRLTNAHAHIHKPLTVRVLAADSSRLMLSADLVVSGVSSLWSSGVIVAPAAPSPEPRLRILEGGTLSLTYSRINPMLENAGRLNAAQGLSIPHAYIVGLENLGTGVFNVNGGVRIGTKGIDNAGEIVLNPAARLIMEGGAFISSGQIRVAANLVRMELSGGELSGTVLIPVNNTLIVTSQNFIFAEGSLVHGGGTLELGGPGSAVAQVVRGEIRVPTLRINGRTDFDGGRFTGTTLAVNGGMLGAVQDLSFENIPVRITVSGGGSLGAQGQAGRIVLGRTPLVEFIGPAINHIRGIIITYGDVWLESGSLRFGEGGRLIVAPGATFRVREGAIELRPASLIIRGTFIKDLTTDVRLVSHAGDPVPLDGNFIIQGGALQIATNGRHGASFLVGSGARLIFEDQPHRLAPLGSITGAGLLAIASGSLTVWGAVDVGRIEVWAGGRLILGQDVTVAAGSVLVSGGAVALSAGSLLHVSGAYEQAGGVLRIHAAGAGRYGRIVAAEVQLLGQAALRVHLGYAPAAGEVLEFITAPQRTGQFHSAMVLNLPTPAPEWMLEYLPGAVRLHFAG
jgi:hypothetical protein